MSDSLQNFGASYMMKNRTPEFTIMYEYTQTFGEKLASIDRITQRVVKEQSGKYMCTWKCSIIYISIGIMKKYFFLFLRENQHCGYSLEVPHWDAFNEYLQQAFLYPATR